MRSCNIVCNIFQPNHFPIQHMLLSSRRMHIIIHRNFLTAKVCLRFWAAAQACQPTVCHHDFTECHPAGHILLRLILFIIIISVIAFMTTLGLSAIEVRSHLSEPLAALFEKSSTNRKSRPSFRKAIFNWLKVHLQYREQKNSIQESVLFKTGWFVLERGQNRDVSLTN